MVYKTIAFIDFQISLNRFGKVLYWQGYNRKRGKVKGMAANMRREWGWHEGLITAIAVGGTFILLGLVVILTPNFGVKFGNFISDFTFIYYPFGTGTISFPTPQNPAIHQSLFTAAMYFAIGIAILQVLILPLRLAFKSRLSRIAETVGNLVFWVGAAFVANIYLLAGTIEGWFQFWAYLIILAGISLIVRGVVQFSKGFGRSSETGS